MKPHLPNSALVQPKTSRIKPMDRAGLRSRQLFPTRGVDCTESDNLTLCTRILVNFECDTSCIRSSTRKLVETFAMVHGGLR